MRNLINSIARRFYDYILLFCGFYNTQINKYASERENYLHFSSLRNANKNIILFYIFIFNNMRIVNFLRLSRKMCTIFNILSYEL